MNDKCEARVSSESITLYHGDITHLDAINGFQNASTSQTSPTSDFVLARYVLGSIKVSDQANILRHWASYMTPITGRMVVSFFIRQTALGSES